MFTRKSEKVKNLPQTSSQINYKINDDLMQVDIDIRVNSKTTFTIQELVEELKDKANKDIQKYDIKSITFKSLDRQDYDIDLY